MNMPTLPLTTVLALAASGAALAQDARPVAFTNARLVTIAGAPIERGTLVVKNGKIEAIGADVAVPAGARVLDATGCTILPGLVSAVSRAGLVDRRQAPSGPLPGARRGGRFDVPEAPQGGGNASIAAATKIVASLQPKQPIFGELLRLGVTSLALSPTGSGFPGLGAVLRPDGKTLEQLTVDDDAFVQIVMTRDSATKKAVKEQFEKAKKIVEERDGLLRILLHRAQLRTDQLELEAVRHLAIGQGVSAVLDVRNPLIGDRVSSEIDRGAGLEHPGGLLEPLQEDGHGMGVEPGPLENLHADPVGLPLVVAREGELVRKGLCLGCRDRACRGLGIGTGCQDRHGDRRHGRETLALLCRDEPCDVPLGHVRDFVGENGREFRFALGSQEQGRVHTDESSRQCEGVHCVVEQSEEREVLTGIRTHRHQPIAKPVQVVLDFRIVQVGGGRTDLPHDVVADRTFLSRRQRGSGRIAQFRQFIGLGAGQGNGEGNSGQ